METTDIERTATNPTPTTRDVPSRTLPKPTKEQAGKGNTRIVEMNGSRLDMVFDGVVWVVIAVSSAN